MLSTMKSYILGLIISAAITVIALLSLSFFYLKDWSHLISHATIIKDISRNASTRTASLDSDAIKDKLTDVQPTPSTTQSAIFKCQRCAYIAGSGHMKNSASGQEIDAHDCVFRPNDSPTLGYEADVGEKTTMRTVDLRSLTFIRRRLRSGKSFDKSYKNMTFVIYEPDEIRLAKASEVGKDLKKSYPGMNFNEMKPEMIKYIIDLYEKEVDSIKREVWITNGFYSLLYMGEICSYITVYGMSYANYCTEKDTKKVQYHYYEMGETECSVYNRHSKAKSSTHRFLKEKRVLNKWKGTWKNLTFRNPAWPVT